MKVQLIVWWAIWFAMQCAVFLYYLFLGGTPPDTNPEPNTTASGADLIYWVMGVAPFALSVLIRWLILPLAKNVQIGLVLFIMGLALAEMSCLIGIFVFPSQMKLLFILSVLGVLQFVPLFAARFYK